MSRRSSRHEASSVLLAADLALPAGHLAVAAGQVGRLPDDPRHVAALRGDDRDREHRVRLAGRRLDRLGPSARVRAGLVTVGRAPVAPEVSVAAHLAAVTRPATARARLAATPRLAGRGGDPAGVLSGGERRLLAWSLAGVLQPHVVILDRAGTGLDAEALAWAGEQVAAWAASGVAVLVRVGREEERGWPDS